MKTTFWITLAIAYLGLAIISFLFNNKIDKQYKRAKADYKKDYGFNTYGVFELVQQYSDLSTKVNLIGFVLAGLAALASLL